MSLLYDGPGVIHSINMGCTHIHFLLAQFFLGIKTELDARMHSACRSWYQWSLAAWRDQLKSRAARYNLRHQCIAAVFLYINLNERQWLSGPLVRARPLRRSGLTLDIICQAGNHYAAWCPPTFRLPFAPFPHARGGVHENVVFILLLVNETASSLRQGCLSLD